MNIQNIKELSKKLELLGFKDLSFALFQRICFKPNEFSLARKIQEDKDWLNIQIFFKKSTNTDEYLLLYYDAILQKEMVFAESIINGINVQNLDQQMKDIDWAVFFDSDGRKKWNLDDELSLDLGRKIEGVVEQLSTLGTTSEGNIFATGFKIKYWAGQFDQDLLDSTSPFKSQSQFNQRFYFFEKQTGITVSEAYRFLLNKWLEKEMLEKEKDASDKKKERGNGLNISGNSLLKKKRVSHTAKSKIIN